MDTPSGETEWRCSFCGRPESVAGSLARGAGGAAICADCVGGYFRHPERERESRPPVQEPAADVTPGPMQPGGMAFDRYTARARKVLTLAQEEAKRFNHNYIGTEHLLLGVVSEGEGIAARVLADLGIELDKVRSAVEFIIGRGERQVMGDIGLTPRAKKVLALAADEAQRLGHDYIGTEHILLGLIREGEGIAAGVLESLGVNLEKVRSSVLRVLGAGDAGLPMPEPSRPDPRFRFRHRSDRPSSGGSFDRFTERARKVLALAQEEAQRLNQNYIGTEHLFLGLLREGEGVAVKVLTNLGIELAKVRSAVEFIVERGEHQAKGNIGLTPRAKKTIELAVAEARALGHHYIGTEHLLLGLIGEGEGIPAGILESLGVTLEKARDEVHRILGEMNQE